MTYQKSVCLQQITKETAQSLYYEGLEIFLNPCKLSLCNAWTSPFNVKKEGVAIRGQFDEICDNFAHYNCTKETGTYLHFYVDVKELKNEFNELIETANKLNGFSFELKATICDRNKAQKYILRLNGKRLYTKGVTLPTAFIHFCKAI